MNAPDLPSGLVRATDVLGATVKNEHGVSVGKIDDLVLDVERSRIAYGVLSFGGFLGMGEKLFALPWPTLSHRGGVKEPVLHVDPERLKNAPGFDRNHWPSMSQPWGTDIHSYYGTQAYWTQPATSEPLAAGATAPVNPKTPELPFHLRRAHELLGLKVRGAKDETLGKVEDIVVDVLTGRVAYVVLSFGGFLGIGDKHFAVPFRSLTIPATGDALLPSVDKERLKNAPGFDKTAWPNMADPRWEGDIQAFWVVRSTTVVNRAGGERTASESFPE